VRKAVLIGTLALVLATASAAFAGEDCPTPSDEIETDRPDVTNSSLVVPTGSFQAENGTNYSAVGRARIVDATNSRLRLGVDRCTELLLDLPTAFLTTRGRPRAASSDVAPGLKRQLFSGGFSASGVIGVLLPTGDARISGRGYAPYLQFPWARDLSDGWGISGMVTLTMTPSEARTNPTSQVTFEIEHTVGARGDVFIEGIGCVPAQGHSCKRLNSGAAYRLTRTQQIDFHAGMGLDAASPDWFVGVGYSFRFDGLF
jgi:hypothetical protein